MYVLDGKILQIDTPFKHDGVSYPANWLRLSTQEDRDAIGITEAPEYPRPDDRFYYVTQNEDWTWNATPKDLSQLKAQWQDILKHQAYARLLPTDWMVVRHIEEGVEIPGDWKSWRASVRTYAGTKSDEIAAAADIDALIAVVTNIVWPLDPDAVAAQNAAEANAPAV